MKAIPRQIALITLACVVLAYAARAARAADDPWNTARIAVHAYSDKNGLPQNSVNALAFDSHGRLWVGTQDGVVVYDGRGFRPVALPSTVHTIHTIRITPDDTVYLGTMDAGLIRIQGESQTVLDAAHGMPDDEVYAVLARTAEDGARELWVGTNAGLGRLVGDVWKKFSKADGLPSGQVLALAETHEGATRTLWAGTGKGLARLDGERWVPLVVPGMSGVVDTLVVTHGGDGADALYVGTLHGVCKLEHGACSETYDAARGLLDSEVNTFIETTDAHGSPSLFIGSRHSGLWNFVRGGSPALLDAARGLPGNIVSALAMTPTGDPKVAPHTLWVGLNSRGLARIELGTWRSIDVSLGLPSPSVYSVLESSGPGDEPVYWLGTLGGLARFDKGHWVDTGLTNKPVLTLIQSQKDHAVLVGVDGGIARMKDGQTTTWIREKDGLPGPGLLSLKETPSPSGGERVWAAAQEGLALIDDSRVTKVWREGDGLPSDVVIALAETVRKDGGRTLWVGTMLGLASIDESSLAITKHPFGKDPSSRFVLSLFSETGADGKTTLWAGTKAGPWRATMGEGEPTWTPLSDAVMGKLPNLVTNHLERDSRGRLYVFTNRGIARVSSRTADASDLADATVEVFGVEDGLPSGECGTGASMIDRHGRIWAGTAEGAALFDPATEIEDHTPKPLAFEGVAAGGKERARSLSGTTLRHDEANVVYEYALASYFKESETRYRTQLEGWEPAATPWTDSARREYSNLPAGRYTFRVWGRDWAGNVAGPLEDSFVVRAAPWRTPLAYGSYGGLLAILGFSVVRLRERSLRAKNAALEANVQARTKELNVKNDELARNNDALAENVEQLRVAEQKAEAKAKELDQNVSELERVNERLVASQVQADRIFSALAEALPGTVLEGKYRLDVKVGAGGFGAVFRATHLGLKQPVAVKVFRPSPGNDSAEAVERFRREGETTSLLKHPNAVRVFDAGISADGIAYIVMEMLVGHPLSEEIEERRCLSVERAWQVLAPVADVLSAAHAIGLVHRDIKPSNIFLHTDEGREVVKVVDFGLAKLVGEDSGPAEDKLTRTGRVVGTPVYMAPERLGSRTSDIPSDVYSVGVVVYEMLTGRTPFKEVSQNLVALLLAHLNQGPPNVRSFSPSVPEEVDRVVMSALAAEPGHRPTMDELAARFAKAAGFEYVKAARSPSGSTVASTDPARFR